MKKKNNEKLSSPGAEFRREKGIVKACFYKLKRIAMPLAVAGMLLLVLGTALSGDVQYRAVTLTVECLVLTVAIASFRELVKRE